MASPYASNTLRTTLHLTHAVKELVLKGAISVRARTSDVEHGPKSTGGPESRPPEVHV